MPFALMRQKSPMVEEAFLLMKNIRILSEKLNKEGKFRFLMSDFNIDLMKMDSKFGNSQFYDTMCTYFFSPLIPQPTRVTEKSNTLIDNISCNSFEFTTISGNVTHSISDYLIQFVILEDFMKPSSPYKSKYL